MDHLINKKNEHNNMFKFTIIIIITTFAYGIYREYNITQRENQVDNSHWVMDNSTGSVAKMKKEATTVNHIDLEGKHHIRQFFHNMFEFDQYTYRRNIEIASHLIATKDFKRIYSEQAKIELQKFLEEHDIRSIIKIDDIHIDFNSTPITATVKAVQTQNSVGFTKSRRMDAIFNIEQLEGRTNKNPHNMNIYNFKFTNTKEL